MRFTQKLMYMVLGGVLVLAGYILASLANESVAQSGAEDANTGISTEAPKKIVILNGVPSVKVVSSAGVTERQELTDAEKNQFRVLVTKIDDMYVWETRGKKLLFKTQSGVHRHFISPEGSGYVKVVAAGTPQDEPLSYMEHLNMGLMTVTYWGTLEDFQDD